MAIRSTQGRKRAARSTQGGVTLMVMDCGACIIFIRFRIPDQVYCNKSQKNNFLFKTFFFQKQIYAPSPLHRLGTVLHSLFHVNVSVFVKRGWM